MKTLYEELGQANLRLMVDTFYEFVMDDPRISHLFTTDLSVVRDKQYRFLTQFFGGPQLYSEQYGHPRMRMRHLPHKIGQPERDAWLENMRRAVDSLAINAELKDAVYNCFPPVASHMVNS